MPNGSFFGGVAQGFTSGLGAVTQFSTAKAQLEQLKVKRDQAASVADKELDKFFADIQPQLASAALIPDEQRRDLTVSSLFEVIEQRTGSKHQSLRQLFKKDPQQALDLLQSGLEAGQTPGQIARTAGDPRARAAALLALAERDRLQRSAAAQSGTAEGDTPAPSAAVSAPTPQTEAAAVLVEQQIGNIRKRIETAVKAGASDRVVAAMQSQLDSRQQLLERLRLTPALAEVERSRALIPADVLAQTGGEFGRRVSDLPTFQQGAPAGPPAAPAVSGTAPRVAAPGGGTPTPQGAPPRFESPQERRDALRRSQPVSSLGERLSREAAQMGARTVGEFEDVQARGTRPLSQAEAERREKAASTGEELAKTQEDRFAKSAETAVEMRSALSAMSRALQQSGPTGKVTDAIRQPLMQFATLFGVRPERLAALEEVRSLQIFLATQVLKDFTGNDSDREFLAAIEKSPGLGKQPTTNANLIRVGLNNARLQVERSQFAEAWRAKYGSTASKNADGFTFKQNFDAYRNLPQNRALERPTGGFR